MRRPNHYHKGHTHAEHLQADREGQQRRRAVALRDKPVIVWDGEGMKLSGPDKPQHYVLFGCSARPDDPLVIQHDTDRLTFEQLADYIVEVAREHPGALHLGYFFRYDQNMIIWSLPWPAKHAIYDRNGCRIRRNGKLYTVKVMFGKTIRITRIDGDEKISVIIEDIAPFFGTSFVKAYESLLPSAVHQDRWAVVVEGKKRRADTVYADMPSVIHYWQAEILALRELAVEFRRLMFDGGFMLRDWYGPGALANYLRKQHKLVDHEWGGKEENLPSQVHDAVKGAFYGGHIEPYQVGVIKGPIYGYDKNSAYPSAFCHVPSLNSGGAWENRGAVSRDEWYRDKELRLGFAVFRVRWLGPTSHPEFMRRNTVIQPLPHRSARSQISYPMHTDGWYWAPEVGVAMDYARMDKRAECEISDCWIWRPSEPVTWPWEELMRGMYEERLKLKAPPYNPVEWCYKLGMNSLYGKYAQRIGGKDKAPPSHTLPIAGYVTSSCRAAVMKLMLSADKGSVISVETDGVYTTTPPDRLRGNFPLSNKLGEWSMTVYDEMIMVQNGVYLLRQGDEWKPPKSRGIPASVVKRDAILEHFEKCTGEKWPKLTFQSKESFIGLGAAVSRATFVNRRGRRSTNPFKARALHCTWADAPKEIDVEGWGSKRSHVAKACPVCRQGLNPAQAPHPLTIHSEADRWTAKPTDWISHAHTLPWEKGHEAEEWRQLAEAEGHYPNADGDVT